MGFVHYRVVLKLLSPLHIGKRKYRNLMETRDYVPGRTLWGALTARIVRDYFDGRKDMYEKIGNFLNENFRFGYLWPSLDGENPYFPWEHEDFDYLLKSGYMGQPVDYTRGATDEGQLHEAEFIAPKTRDGRQVYLIGDLWVNDKNGFIASKETLKVQIEGKTVVLKDIFNSLQLGGERSYGWGRVGEARLLKQENARTIGNVKVTNDVTLNFPAGGRLTSHLIANKVKSVMGEVEPLTGYRYDSTKGWYMQDPPVCFVPGSKITSPIKTKFSEEFPGVLEISE